MQNPTLDERRYIQKRYRKRVEVRYGPEGPQHTGYSGNISRSGIMIRAMRVYPPGKILELELRLPVGKVAARARVTWAREGSMSLLSTGRIGMGLKFIDPPAQLFEFLDRSAV